MSDRDDVLDLADTLRRIASRIDLLLRQDIPGQQEWPREHLLQVLREIRDEASNAAHGRGE